MTTAVVSDIHGNAVAMQAVLADIEKRSVDRIICLGDIIGYGARPTQCVDMVRERCAWSLMGNHDFGVLYEPTNFNPAAEASAYWTRAQFDAEPDEELRAARYDFLGRLRVRVVEEHPSGTGTMLAVHGSPRRPVNEYIFPEDVEASPDKIESIFERIERLCIVGHTHQPGVFTDENEFYPPSELGNNSYTFEPDEKAIINVGSVGQPRDHDPRASYVILTPERAEFHRVEYDIESTAAAIRAVPELHDWLAERLFEGR